MTWVVINRHVIGHNTRTGGNEPPIRITTGKSGKPRYAHRIKINGPSELIYDPYEPVMPCGAKMALRTEAEVEIVS